MSFPYTVGLAYGRDKKTSSTKAHPLGTRGMTPDGRVFYYSQAGGPDLAANVLVQAKATESQRTGANVALTPATSVGDWSGSNIPTGSASIGVVWVTAHASAEFVDGYMTVETAPGTGTYRIVGDSDTGSSNTVTVIRLHPQDTIQDAALTTVSKLALHQNPYASVIVAPTDLTNIVLGVPNVAVTGGEYFWCQTAGPGAVRYSSLVAAVVGEEIKGGIGATAGNAAGSPRTTVITTAAIGSTLNQLTYGSRPTIGYAMDGIPGNGDLLKVMFTIRG